MYQPPHPGEVLDELCLAPLELTPEQASAALGISVDVLTAVLEQRAAITPELAIRLSKAFNTSAESWLNQQMHYDLWLAEQRLGDIEVQPLSPA
jgi:addiction module HigA family antidote